MSTVIILDIPLKDIKIVKVCEVWKGKKECMITEFVKKPTRSIKKENRLAYTILFRQTFSGVSSFFTLPTTPFSF